MDQLDDIYIPVQSIWSNLLQPGWISMCTLFFVCIIGAMLFFRTAAQRAVRKRFTKYLHNHPQLPAEQINAILKAYIRALKQQVHTAQLHGQSWRAFLLANCNMQGQMQRLDFLSLQQYNKPEQQQHIDQLNTLAIHWIQHHKKTLTQPMTDPFSSPNV